MSLHHKHRIPQHSGFRSKPAELTSRRPPLWGTKAASLEYHLLFSNHLSKSVAFQQTWVLKLLAARL